MRPERANPPCKQGSRTNALVAGGCGLFAAFMVGAAYAAVPLYNWFCRTTGFGGTPRIAAAAPARVTDRTIAIRFDANVAGGLPWRFEPETTEVSIKVGEVVTASYRVTNQSARETAGIASYNVSPATVGAYFTKINCFCFNEQRLRPGEQRDMPVVFFVDPQIMKDTDQDGLDSITLSYTMYPVREPHPRQSSALAAHGNLAGQGDASGAADRHQGDRP